MESFESIISNYPAGTKAKEKSSGKNTACRYIPSKDAKSSYSISSIFPDAQTRKEVLAEVNKSDK